MIAIDLRVIVLLLATKGLVPGVSGSRPGFQIRVTEQGLRYANTLGIKTLSKYVNNAHLPEFSKSSHGLHFSVHDVKVTSFSAPTNEIDLNPNKGLTWSGKDVDIRVDGGFHVKAWIIGYHGGFDVHVSHLDYSIGIVVGKDNTGRPKISAGKCKSHIGHVGISFHGVGSSIINLFSSFASSKVKSILNSKICSQVKDQINGLGEKELRTLPVQVVIANRFVLDYRLTNPPTITSDYIDTFYKGEVYWKGASNKAAPFQPGPLPAEGDTSKMAYLWVSDYVFNTMAYVAQQNGFSTLTVTNNDLPAGIRGALNTTCTSVCIGDLIPEIGQKYPDSEVELNIVCPSAARVQIHKGKFVISSNMAIYMFVDTAKHTPADLLTLNASMSASVTVRLQDGSLYGKINALTVQLNVEHSSMGSIEEKAIEFLANEALTKVLTPKLNAYLADGFPLPTPAGFKLLKTELTLAEGAIIIATDVEESAGEIGGMDVLVSLYQTEMSAL